MIQPSDEVKRQRDAVTQLYQAGRADGLAGRAMPSEPGVSRDGWVAGDVRRRILSGEVLGYIFHVTQCKACGNQDEAPRVSRRPVGLSHTVAA